MVQLRGCIPYYLILLRNIPSKKGGTPYGASGRMLGGSLRKVYMVGLMQVGNY
jgi:hypothetical protein